MGVAGTLAGVLGLALAPGAEAAPGVTAAPGAEAAPGVTAAPGVPEVRSAAAEAVVLTWEAPAQCPGEAAVRLGLATYLGEGPSAEAGAGVRAVARVTEDDGRLRLALRTETDSGVTTRETTADDCAVLVDATALIVAIAVDPSTVLGRTEARTTAAAEAGAVEREAVEREAVEGEAVEREAGSVEPDPVADVEPAESDEPPLEPADAAPPEPKVRFGMRVAGGIDGGVLPGVAGGLRLAGAVLGRGWRAELRGDYWLPRSAVAAEGIGGRISLGSAGVRGCGVPGVARVGLEFPLCGGLEGGAMRGDPIGRRVANPVTARQPWLAADASAGLAWAPRRFLALVVQAELVVPIVRAGFRVGEVEVHRAGPVAGRGLIGLEARFP